MIKFTLWIVTPDGETSDKWYSVFSRARFSVTPLPDLAAISGISKDAWGLALVEICANGLASPKDLKTLLNGRNNIAVIVFSQPGKISNSEISGFLENGADDFITSDIDEEVLLAKTKAHMRRLLPSLNMARTHIKSADGRIEADRVAKTVKLRLPSGKNKILDDLTPKEFEIFFMFLSNEDRVVSRKSLMETIWQEKSGHVNFETIDKHVEALRHKLGAYGENIKTVYGTGYTYKSRAEETL